MFSSIWKKYLPVIALHLKKAANADQIISLNQSDFARAAGGRKLKYSFSTLQINNGRINNLIKNNNIAIEFATILKEDDLTKGTMLTLCVEFSMTNDCKLSIKNIALKDETNEDNVIVNEEQPLVDEEATS